MSTKKEKPVKKVTKKATPKKEAKNTNKQDEKVAVENKAITDKMSELAVTVGRASEEGNGTMLCLVYSDTGVHIAMSGAGEDLAVLIATAMHSHEMVGSVIAHGGMMAAMKKNEEAREEAMDENGAEKAPEDLPTPQTKA